MEPHNFNCEIIDGHCIIRDQGNVILLDTGSPVTIHETKTLKFLGDDFATQDQYQTNIPELRHLTGLDDLTTLMGTDILRQYKLWFNYKYQKVIFGSPNMQ